MASTLGQRIKFLRGLEKLSQLGFANRIGISRSYVSEAENDTHRPTADILIKIAKHYDINLDWLMTGEGEMKIEPSSKTEQLAFNTTTKLAQALHLTMPEVSDLIELVQGSEDTNYFRLLIKALKGDEAAKKELLIKLIKE